MTLRLQGLNFIRMWDDCLRLKIVWTLLTVHSLTLRCLRQYCDNFVFLRDDSDITEKWLRLLWTVLLGLIIVYIITYYSFFEYEMTGNLLGDDCKMTEMTVRWMRDD